MDKQTNPEAAKQDRKGPTTLTAAELDQVCGGRGAGGATVTNLDGGQPELITTAKTPHQRTITPGSGVQPT